jgi:hypothetical protein
VIARTSAKYREAPRRPTGKGLWTERAVGIVTGSTLDWETMVAAAKMLADFAVVRSEGDVGAPHAEGGRRVG